MVNHIRPRIYLVSFSCKGHSYHIYSSAFPLSQPSCIALYASLDIWYPLLQPVALSRCPSVVMFILLQHRASRLIVLQYSRAAFLAVSHLVTSQSVPSVEGSRQSSYWIPICSPSTVILVATKSQWSSLGSCLNCLSWCHSVTVSCDAVWGLSLAMPFGRVCGTFRDHFRSRSELLW